MRRTLLWTAALVSIIAVGVGCSGQQQTTSDMTMSDSLLASNPVETPEGSMTPQAEYQEPTPEPPAQQTSSPPTSKPRQRTPRPESHPEKPAPVTGVSLSAGTPISITVDSQVSSETASSGDTWTGTVKDAVVVGDKVVIPAGSTVHGVVRSSMAAERGARAFLVLGINSISVNGTSVPVHASADSIIAGSTRARNVGAIAGGTAAGAIIGKAVGGGGKGAVIGGLIGGAAATAGVAKSKGFQVVIKEGTPLTFAVTETVRIPT